MVRKILIGGSIFLFIFFASCGGGGQESKINKYSIDDSSTTTVAESASYDPTRGEGKFDASNVVLGALDAASASKGKIISETKCFACHRLTNEKLVGPGWQDVTKRRTPHWILNFITNPDPMIDKDPEVQAQLELCLVRMPNQNLTEAEAREVLEYMRQNDGVK